MSPEEQYPRMTSVLHMATYTAKEVCGSGIRVSGRDFMCLDYQGLQILLVRTQTMTRDDRHSVSAQDPAALQGC